MDTITHGLAGALLGRAAVSDNAGGAVAVAAVAAMCPDLDAFLVPGSWFHLSDTMGYLRYHRGVTHSFLLAPLLAAALAGIALPVLRRSRYFRLWTLALLAVLSHILLDWITSYGTMFLAPLSWKRYSLDWVFILDPFFTGILAVSGLAAFLWRRRGAARPISAAGLAALALYIGMCAVLHGRAVQTARRILGHGEIAALPQPFSPFRWMLLADRGSDIEAAYVDLGPSAPIRAVSSTAAPPASIGEAIRRLGVAYSAPSTARILHFATNRGATVVASARRFPDVRSWYAFARFPVASAEPLEGRGWRVTMTDLRFRGPWRATAFQYEALFSEDGRELESGFVREFSWGSPRRRRREGRARRTS